MTETAAAPKAAQQSKAVAARWSFVKRLVAQSGRSKNSAAPSEVSVRRHTTFGLFPCERWQPAESKKEDVLYHHVQYTLEKRALRFRIRAGDVSLSDIKLAQDSKVDNTGNVCVWPSEEVLAFYCVTDAALCKQLQGKRVLELGAGQCGLAGIAVAACCSPKSVLITDGNPAAARMLEANVELNAKLYSGSTAASTAADADAGAGGSTAAASSTPVAARCLKWDRKAAAAGDVPPADVIIAADVLFFKDYHEDLCAVIRHSLQPGGVALLLGPRRGGTLERFVGMARAYGRPAATATAASSGGSESKDTSGSGADRAGSAAAATVAAAGPGCFTVTVREPGAFCDALRAADERERAGNAHYEPDLHCPLLVTVTLNDASAGAAAAASGTGAGISGGSGIRGDQIKVPAEGAS